MWTTILFAIITVTSATWVKEMENPNMWEGDIVLDPDERESTFGQINTYASIKGGRWPGGKVPYVITSSIGQTGRSAIAQAIAQYHSKTCLRFSRRTNEQSYISFYRGNGCSSPVGYRYGRRNDISLAGGCQRSGIVMHEIGHSIGLYHEQSRPDRDNYVTIQWNNIPYKNKFNFNKHGTNTIDSLGTPYDFRSIMHYGTNAFGGSRMTIRTKNGNNQRLIGNRNGFSELDVKQINLMYKCSGTTGGGVTSTCKNMNPRCDEWYRRGECNRNPGYMHNYCKKSCRRC